MIEVSFISVTAKDRKGKMVKGDRVTVVFLHSYQDISEGKEIAMILVGTKLPKDSESNVTCLLIFLLI